MGVLGEWMFGTAMTTGASLVWRILFPNDIDTRLDAVAEAWRANLPADAALDNIQAILPTSYSSHPTNPAPRPIEVLSKLELFQIPFVSDWHSSLLRHWKWVGTAVEGPQAFFLIDEQLASTLLLALAERLTTECQKDRERFQVQSLKNDEALHERMLQVQSTLSSVLDTSHAAKGGFHTRIDEAVEHTQAGSPDAAIALLEALRRKEWHNLDVRMRYRLLANLGHAHNAKEELEKAAHYFIQCKKYQPEDEMARTWEAVGYGMLGQHDKACELANGILNDFPACDLAASALVQHEPDTKPFSEIEANVPSVVKSCSETQLALSRRALEADDLPKAEHYARLVYDANKNSPVAAEQLAVVLLNHARTEAMQQYVHQPRVRSKALQEAKQLFEKARAATSGSNQLTVARLRFFQGVVCLLEGEQATAEGHFRFAYEVNPSNPDFARHLALVHDDFGRTDDAIDTLRGIPHDRSGRSTILLAALLLARSRQGDIDDAITRVEAMLQEPGLSSFMRIEGVAFLAHALAQHGQHDVAHNVLERERSTIGPTAYELIKAQQARRVGAPEEAKAAILAAMQCDEGTDIRLRRMIAEELTNQELWAEALALWKTLVRPNCVGPHTEALLKCAYRLHDDEFILGFCAALRAAGIFESEALHLEINKLLEYNSTDAAIAAMQQCLASTNDKEMEKEIRARLSHLAIITNRPDLSCFDPERLPAAGIVPPDIGLLVVILLTKGPEPVDAVKYAYTLLRRYFDSADAHKAMVISVLGRPRDLVIPTFDTAAPGAAVKYSDDATGEEKWHIIEDEEAQASSRDEYPVDHFRSQELLGKRCGESFYIRRDHIQEKRGTIVAISSKYTYRFNRCMQEWDTQFPNDPFLWKFAFGKEEDGTTDFSSLFQMMAKWDEEIRKVERAYRDSPLSSTCFARMTSVTVLEAVQHLAASDDLPIRYTAGSSNESEAANQSFDGTQTVILDSSAIATLFLLRRGVEVDLYGLIAAVSRGTVSELRELLLQKRDFQGTMFARHGDTYAVTEESAESIASRIKAMEAFVASIERSCKVYDGAALATLALDTRTSFLEVIGRSTAETIALAKERGMVLWSDDVVVSQLAQSAVGVCRVWTDFVQNWAVKQTRLSEDARHEELAKLTGFNYSVTRLTPQAVLFACRNARWDADERQLKRVLRWFATPQIRAIVIVNMAGIVLKSVWQEAPSPFRADIIIQRIIGHISSRADARRILLTVLRRIDALCGVDVETAERLKVTLQVMMPRA